MRIVPFSIDLWDHPYDDEKSMLACLERCGRTCTGSYEKITENSAQGFVERLIKFGHASVLEHVWLKFSFVPKDSRAWSAVMELYQWPLRFLRITRSGASVIIEGSYRSIFQAGLDVPYLRDITTIKQTYPVMFRDWILSGMRVDNSFKWLTPDVYIAHIICDRRTSHQMVRHDGGISQGSQRLQVVRGHVNFIKALYLPELPEGEMDWKAQVKLAETAPKRVVDYTTMCLLGEEYYHEALKDGMLAQDARDGLPNCAATEMIFSWDYERWQHIFKLRCDSHADSPIRYLMEIFESKVEDNRIASAELGVPHVPKH